MFVFSRPRFTPFHAGLLPGGDNLCRPAFIIGA